MYQQKILYQPRKMFTLVCRMVCLLLAHGIASWLKATEVARRNPAGAGQASLHYVALLVLMVLLFL